MRKQNGKKVIITNLLMDFKVSQVMLGDMWGPSCQLTICWGMLQIVCFVTHFWSAIWYPFSILIILYKKTCTISNNIIRNTEWYCISTVANYSLSSSSYSKFVIYKSTYLLLFMLKVTSATKGLLPKMWHEAQVKNFFIL